ncbi:MAG: hypothetical protein WA655_06835 [Candidatus Korobacteraceae bacterium]
MKETVSPYVVSLQAETVYKRTRHHWVVCRTQSPEQMVSWGYEPTRELAESAAEREIQDLSSGLTQGGQVGSTIRPFTHRIADRYY